MSYARLAPALLPTLDRRRPPVILRGWARPDRAPGLRARAALLELRADASEHPDRVRRLAREFRLRATEVELGAHAVDELAELTDTLDGMR